MKQSQLIKKGKLLVFEGIDGSGKTTQIDLLTNYLSDKNIPYEVISFPQYGKNEYADQIYDYLSGKLGKISEIDPYKVVELYANDRKTAREQILNWLGNGKLVIANRFISSSKAHLGANLPVAKREEFIKWIEELEYEANGMPREDLTILLSVDPKVGQKNSQEKNHPDIHEDNLKHLQKASQIFLELSKKENNWVVVNCMDNGQMKSEQTIHREILNILKGKIFKID